MSEENGVTKDEVIEIIRCLEVKFYSIGTQTRRLGIALFLIGMFAAIIGTVGWGLVTLVLGITVAVIGSITQYYFGPKMEL